MRGVIVLYPGCGHGAGRGGRPAGTGDPSGTGNAGEHSRMGDDPELCLHSCWRRGWTGTSKKLNALGLSDAKVCMFHFYPELKQEITDSWQRLFDPSVSAGNDSCYGTVWELRKEWLVQVL